MSDARRLPAPPTSDDGRPYVAWAGEGEAMIWLPSPPRHGDDAWCNGVWIGEVYGDVTAPGKGVVVTLPLAGLPPVLAERLRAMRGRRG